nr:unnamed protein product [Digitaria exilis]
MHRRTVSRGSSSRASQQANTVGKETGLPLIQCTSCGLARIIELRAWTDGNNGRVFFKCPRNIQGAPDKCGFFYWQREYLQELVGMRRITVHEEPQLGSSSEEAESPYIL